MLEGRAGRAQFVGGPAPEKKTPPMTDSQKLNIVLGKHYDKASPPNWAGVLFKVHVLDEQEVNVQKISAPGDPPFNGPGEAATIPVHRIPVHRIPVVAILARIDRPIAANTGRNERRVELAEALAVILKRGTEGDLVIKREAVARHGRELKCEEHGPELVEYLAASPIRHE